MKQPIDPTDLSLGYGLDFQTLSNYYPFGMQMPDMAWSSGDTYRYGFNGMERDNEIYGKSNSYDFGARMMDPRLGRFLSLDPLAKKYSSLSDYAFVANNPVIFVDPDGREIWIAFEVVNKSTGKSKIEVVQYINEGLYKTDGSSYTGSDKYANLVLKDLNQLKTDDIEVSEVITDLEFSENVHLIKLVTDPNVGNKASYDKKHVLEGVSTGSTIEYDPNVRETREGKRNPRVGLAHELSHVDDAEKGNYSEEETENGIDINEVNAVKFENRIRKNTGDKPRTNYGGKEIPKKYLEPNKKKKK